MPAVFVDFSAIAGDGDPTRLAAQVVSGIGFLGAGIILYQGINVHSLNTAPPLGARRWSAHFVEADSRLWEWVRRLLR